MVRPELAEAFWKRVARTENDACWLWTGTVHAVHRYGEMQFGSRGNTSRFRAHRLSWLVHHNYECPEGLVVMHLCDERRCVNPLHLVLGTVPTNNWDTRRKGRHHHGDTRQTHCKHGHPFTPENTYRSPATTGRASQRACRTCRARKDGQRRRTEVHHAVS